MSAFVYSAWRPVKPKAATDWVGSKGQPAGGSERQTWPEPMAGSGVLAPLSCWAAAAAARAELTANDSTAVVTANIILCMVIKD